LAKKLVYGTVGIDSLAGPSEVLIIADETANPVHVATDLLAQAEHDPMAAAILITTDAGLAKKSPSSCRKTTGRSSATNRHRKGDRPLWLNSRS
jgi:histidinol dehydrogenase